MTRECAVRVDASIYAKWIGESLSISGYTVLAKDYAVTKSNSDNSWVIELRVVVER